MSTTQKIAHNSAIQLIGKGIGTFFGLLAIAILTRHLGVEQFGWYATAIGFLQFTGVLADFGFTAATSSLLANPRFDQKKLLNNIFTMRFLSGLFFNGAAAAIIFLFPYRFEIKLAVVILSISFFFISLNQIFWGYYQKKLRMAIPAIAEILSRTILVIGLYLLMIGNSGFIPMMITITVASGFLTFYMWLRSEGVKFYLEKNLTLKILTHMWPLAIAVIFNSLYLHGDKLLIPLYVDQIDVGLYGAAYRVIEIIIQVMALTAGILMPLVAYAHNTKNRMEFKRLYQLTFDVMSLIVMPMTAGLVALATPIMVLVAGSDFALSGSILQMLTLAVLGILFGVTFSNLAIAISAQKKTLWIFIAVSLLAIVAYFIFIPLYGIWGAVAVSVAAELLAGALLFFYTSKLSKFTPSFKAFSKILLSSIIMGALVYTIPSPHVLISIIYGIIIYSALVVVFKIISIQTLQEIIAKKQ